MPTTLTAICRMTHSDLPFLFSLSFCYNISFGFIQKCTITQKQRHLLFEQRHITLSYLTHFYFLKRRKRTNLLSLIRTFTDDISGWVIETNGQSNPFFPASSLTTTHLHRLPPHHLSINSTMVIPNTRITRIIIKRLLSNPRLHCFARRQYPSTHPHLISSVPAPAQLREPAPLLVALESSQSICKTRQILTPLQRLHPHLCSCSVVGF